MATRTVPQPVEHLSEDAFLARIHEKPSLEFIDGAVYRKPVAGKRHGRLAQRLDYEFYVYGSRHGGWGGPEIHSNFSDAFRRIYRVPDVSYWAADKPEGETDIGAPPTLAVEIRSPGQSMDELREKCRFMRANGVDVCWLIDAASGTIEAFEGDGVRVLAGEDVLESQHLPGFALELRDLFGVIERGEV